MEIHNIKGWYISETPFSIHAESVGEKKRTRIQGLLLPRDKVSRNGVMYDWESIKQHYKELIGCPMMYNHVTDGLAARPVGKFTDSWIKEYDDNEGEAGWYYGADLNPNSIYYEDITNGFVDKVSIQINARKVIEEMNTQGEQYQRAFIADILESSVVPVPGFKQTNIEVLMAEAFKYGKIIKEADTTFPLEDFVKGLKDEAEEHPTMDTLEIGQIVLDHLKKNSTYYSTKKESNKIGETSNSQMSIDKEEAMNTTTNKGAVAPKILDKDSNKEEDTMSKEEPKEKKKKEQEEVPIEIPKPTDIKEQDKDEKDKDTKKEQDEDEEEDEEKDVVIKEEYQNDMSLVTSVVEKLSQKIDALREDFDKIKKESPAEDTEADEIEESGDEVAPEEKPKEEKRKRKQNRKC